MHKPHVLAIGNSLLKGIQTKDLTSKCHVDKVNAANISYALSHVDSLSDPPDCIALQVISNEANLHDNPRQTINNTTDKINEFVDLVQHKWSNCKVLVSLAPPRADHHVTSSIQCMINRSVHCDLSGKPGTLVVGHSDFAYNGWSCEELV